MSSTPEDPARAEDPVRPNGPEDEALLRKILEASLDEVSVVRMSDGCFVYVNDEFLKRGYTREEVLGRTVAQLGLWADSEALRRQTLGLRQQGWVRNQEADIRMKDGRVVPYLISSSLIELNGEQCVLSVGREILELKETQGRLKAEIEERERALAERDDVEKRLRESEDRLRKIFEASPETICINSMVDGRYIDWNSQFHSMGYSDKEVASRSSADLGVWANREEFRQFVRKLNARGIVRNMEAAFKLKDGSIFPCLISGAVVELNGERCVVSFTSDISRLKRAELELIAAREAALAALRAKSQFLSSMSHEIRTPMNAILGMADLLGESQLTPEQRRWVETMINNGNALLSLINDILDLAKVESGKLQLEETDFDLGALVESAAETLSTRAAEKGLELVAQLMPGVPRKLVGDPLRLRQILINLLGNAIKFTEAGEIVMTVEQEPAEGGAPAPDGLARLRFSVRDTGIGIAADKLEAIFESFSQADSSTTRKYGGSGLGLAIVSRLVELMGGQIGVESELGKGSTFRFTACFRRQTAPGIEVEPARDLANLRVLVVDDNATNRMILSETLASQGIVVREASGGSEALLEVERARVAQAPYRLILLDCRMPKMDGFQVAEHFKRLPGGVQPIVLMLTSDDISPKLSRVRELGIHSYLVKPIKRSELFAAIRLALGTARAAAQPRPADPQPSAGGTSELRSLRILLAEDSPDNRLLIQAYLRQTPYQLEFAENGQIAVDKFIEAPYDLVLMDIRMPVMDGHTAVRKIREWEKEQGRRPAPIVALTASALEEDVRKSMEAGCTAHVSKPVKKSLLLAAIRELTATSAAEGGADARPPAGCPTRDGRSTA